MSLRALNRYLGLEAYLRTRRSRPRRSRKGAADEPEQLTHLVMIGGHEVSVTEDDVGVAELHEQ